MNSLGEGFLIVGMDARTRVNNEVSPSIPLTHSYWLKRGWADEVSLSQQSRRLGSLQLFHPLKEGYSHLKPGEADSGSTVMPGNSNGC